jgi:nucleoid-associated protein YgaU
MKLTPWLLVVCLGLVGCSGSKSAQNVTEQTPQIELSETDDFVDETAEGPVAEVAPDQVPVTEEIDNSIVETEPLVQESSLENPKPIVMEESSAMKSYTVQKNETLMMISFKLYGDYARWRELANQNTDVLKGGTAVRNGMILNYMTPAEEFVWNPQGNPYLIKTGDTLGAISKEVYTTTKKWKLIWENNRPLIKDPNKIYAGFTIFYPENGREVTAEL